MEPSELPVIDMQIQFKEHSAIKQLNNNDLNYFIEKLINTNETQRYENAPTALKDLGLLSDGIPISKGREVIKSKKNDLYKSEEVKSGRKINKWESSLYVISLLTGIVFASYIYLFNFNSYSETRLVTITPFWVLPTAFGIFGSTTSKENRLVTALIRSAITTGLLIFFIHGIFPQL